MGLAMPRTHAPARDVVDRVRVDAPRSLTYPTVAAVTTSEKIEVYVVREGGLEEYAGQLTVFGLQKNPEGCLEILGAVKRRVEEAPLSELNLSGWM